MPPIPIKHVISFSTEDPKNPADNLLKPEDYYKWKCASGSESKAVVVLQLEKATQIHSIDVGNNGSAFIEILVGRSSWDSGEEFKVLVVASSFMSPSESKSGANSFRVRIFGNDKLNKAVSSEKWDRLKLVCTQPYNKDEGYGLSFINLHSPPEESKQTSRDTSAPATMEFKSKIGKFTLKEESSKDEISIGSYFAKRLQSSPSVSTPSMAASARNASLNIRSNFITLSPSGKGPSSDRNAARSVDADHTRIKKASTSTPMPPLTTKILSPTQVQGKQPEHRPKSDSAPTVGLKQESTKRKFDEMKNTDTSRKHVCSQIQPSQKTKPDTSTPPQKKSKKRVKNRKHPFHKLMENVIFVLSGYKNPERSDLRDKAISMGAQYRPDWSPGCTHLICAFKNTPKFNQVLGKGKIVTHKWIKDCAKRKERVSVKEYRIDGGCSSSESETDDESEQQPPLPGNFPKQNKSVNKIEAGAHDTEQGQSLALEEPEAKDDEPANLGNSTMSYESASEGWDTEDEIQKAKEDLAKIDGSTGVKDIDDDDDDDVDYGGTTEDESDSETKGKKDDEESAKPKGRLSLPELPNYFGGAHFLLYGEFEQKERRLLNRYITAYNGVTDDYMNDKTKFVVSNKDWDDTFTEASTGNSSLEFVRPTWVLRCHEEGCRIPLGSHVIEQTL